MNKYLVKIARQEQKNQESRPHQDQALEKLDRTGGIILNHSLGSGKTLTILKAIKRAQRENSDKDALIVAPASLVSNIDKEINKHGIKIDRKKLQVYSYERASNLVDQLSKQKFSIVALDEAHRIRNPEAKRTKALMEIAKGADKRILSTGTSVYNHPSDMATLLNVAAGYDALPTGRSEFNNKFIRKVNKPQSFTSRILGHKAEQEDALVGGRELGELFKDHVSYYNAKEDVAAKDDFPEVREKIIPVEMSKKQLDYYKLMENKIPFMLRAKLRWNMPMDKKEMAAFNTFSVGTRQVSNSYRHLVQDRDSVEITPKIKKAVDSLVSSQAKDKNFKGVVYSNFLPAGIEEYSKALTEKGIKHSKYTGELSASEKDVIQKEYNSGKTPILLISSAGAEGLDLSGTKKIQHLDGHFHGSKGRQVTGRAVRYKSHSHLPKEERVVEVEHYHSVHPKGMFGNAPTSIDEYLSGLSKDKDKVFDQVTELMKKNN